MKHCSDDKEDRVKDENSKKWCSDMPAFDWKHIQTAPPNSMTDVILKKLISEKQMAENVSTESDNAF